MTPGAVRGGVGTGLLLALALPPFDLFVLAFLAPVPLLAAVGAPSPTRAAPAAGAAGFLGGAVHAAVLLCWIPLALLATPASALSAYLGAVGIAAAIWAMVAWGIARIWAELDLAGPGSRPPPRAATLAIGAVSAAVIWTAGEWLQGRLGPLAFPWLGAGAALAAWPPFAGAADLSGARALSFPVVLAAAFLALWSNHRRRWLIGAALLIPAALAAYGLIRDATLEVEQVARITLVQTDLPRSIDRDAGARTEAALRALEELAAGLPPSHRAPSPDLVVLPEAAIPAVIDAPSTAATRARLQRLVREIGVPVLAGTYMSATASSPRTGRRTASRGRHNAAILLDPRAIAPSGASATSGTSGTRYAKRRLVPLVENPLLRTGRRTGFEPGPEAEPFHLPSASFGVLICFESAFGTEARQRRGRGANFLVILSNDAWLAGPARRIGAPGHVQHARHAVLRALETRTGVARVGNTGRTFVVDPKGRLTGEMPPFTAGTRTAGMSTSSHRTVFVRWGDWAGGISAALGLLLLLAPGAVGFLDPLRGPGYHPRAERWLRPYSGRRRTDEDIEDVREAAGRASGSTMLARPARPILETDQR